MPAVPTVRKAVRDDLDTLDALVAESFRVLGRGHYSDAQIERAVGGIIRVDRGLVSDGTYFVVALEGHPVACGGFSTRHPTIDEQVLPRPRAEVRAMFVRPAAAGRGLGGFLLRHVESEIVRAGFREAYLVATKSGRAFYERSGYVALGDHEVGLPDGTGFGVTFMRRQLDE